MVNQGSFIHLDPLTTLRLSLQITCSLLANSTMIDKFVYRNNTPTPMVRLISMISSRLRSGKSLSENSCCSKVSTPARLSPKSSFLLELNQTQESSLRYSLSLASRAWLPIWPLIAGQSKPF
jgi:hypothetical protein